MRASSILEELARAESSKARDLRLDLRPFMGFGTEASLALPVLQGSQHRENASALMLSVRSMILQLEAVRVSQRSGHPAGIRKSREEGTQLTESLLDPVGVDGGGHCHGGQPLVVVFE